MCGIIGIITKSSPEYSKRAGVMMRSLEHRGPDAGGLAEFDYCTLGHRRLSVIDLATGAQPMYNAGKTVAVTFNGEIYGYQDIKKKLSQYPFRTASDTEVILALYETRGENFVKELPGMFSFALWDNKLQTLIAARDRFGEKPFYYATGKNGEFVFASEIKAVIASGIVEPVLDESSLAHYLHRLYVHPSKTIYSNIHTLPPAHMLVYKNGKMSVSKYWNMPETNEKITLEEAVPEFKRLLFEAVKKQLVSDVPIGAFLSGGLDSTTIVSLASQLSPHLKTFAFGFEGTKNELSFAKAAVEKYGTEHYELHDTDYNIADLLEKMTDVYDEPFADSSNIPTYLISKKTREHATVVLTGDGGDELLGGYGWYHSLMEMEGKQSFDFPGKLLFMQISAQLAMRGNWKNKVNVISKARGFHYQTNYDDILNAHRASNVFFKNEEINYLGIENEADNPAPSWNLKNTIDDAMRDDLENYMPGDILVKVDRASMANSLELRAPFLDVPFAEFAASLPYSLKINSVEDKIIMRRAFEESWPESIRTRSKLGFGAPVKIWLKKPEVAELVNEYLNNPNKKIFQYISFKKSRKYVQQGEYKIWILLVLSMWLEKHSI